MQIIDFTAAHIEQAVQIAKQNYEEERGYVPTLPLVEKMPDLMPFAENGLGVAVFEGNTMLGFMCSIPPFERPFHIPNAMGAYVPLHAHGATHENRARIYAAMYETAADKWLKAGATNHAITLYAHDTTAQAQFFQRIARSCGGCIGARGIQTAWRGFRELQSFGFWVLAQAFQRIHSQCCAVY